MARTIGKVKRNLSKVCLIKISRKRVSYCLSHKKKIYIFCSFSFAVTHVLSNADYDWSGLRGRVRKEFMEQFLPLEANSQGNLLVCACGPTPFTKEVIRYIIIEHLMNCIVFPCISFCKYAQFLCQKV